MTPRAWKYGLRVVHKHTGREVHSVRPVPAYRLEATRTQLRQSVDRTKFSVRQRRERH